MSSYTKKVDIAPKLGPDWDKIGEKVGKKITKGLESLLDGFMEYIDILKGSLDKFSEMSKFSLETSLTINSDIRDQALQYGLNDAQNYALSKTQEIMGISSEEDMYTMTPAQQERFADLIGKYTSQYQEIADKDLFSTYEEYQKEMQDFKDELQMEVIEFFANNKDTIISVMDFLMNVLSDILGVITWINNFLNGDNSINTKETSALVSDVIDSYTVSSSRTTNVKIDNSFSNISPNEQSQYINAGKRVNEQLIAVLDE